MLSRLLSQILPVARNSIKLSAPVSVFRRGFADDSAASSKSGDPITTVLTDISKDKSPQTPPPAKPKFKPDPKSEKSTESATNVSADTSEKDALADAKAYFSAAPIKMLRAHVDKDKRSHRVGVGEVPEGVAGEKSFEFVDPKVRLFWVIEKRDIVTGDF